MTPESPAQRRGAPTQRCAGSRLRLECLEDRSIPATFNVTTNLDLIDPADGKRSLREAITAANNLAGADVIVLPAGVYKLALTGAGEDANATGDLDVTDAVTISGAGAGLTIIDGQKFDRVFDVSGTAPSSFKVVLEKMTIRNGNVNAHGGGVEYGNADLILRDCAVNGNRASQTGGGVSNVIAPGTGDMRVVRTTVARNVAGTTGGGICLSDSSLTLTDSSVRRNVADDGGGIRVETATLTGSTISGNVAFTGSGGGVFAVSFGSITLNSCIISGNSAALAGGGIWSDTLTLTGCTFSGNTADNAGGIYAQTIATLTKSTISGNSANLSGGGIRATTANLTNCTVSGNMATTDGGGIYALSAAILLNCTVVENSAHTGGGVFRGSGTFSVRNTIIALNLVDFAGTGPDVSGTFVSQGHNLIGNVIGGTGFTNGVNGDIVGTNVDPIDPKLGPLANNGGKTKTHALLAGSRAIDRGDNVGAPITDQRGFGFPRKKDGNGDGIAVVDIGAVER